VTRARRERRDGNWRHTVTLEKLVAATPAPKKPSCIDGARCCPSEDVGGTSGYFEFLRVLLAPEFDETAEQSRMKRWSGGRFNPETFELAKTDKAVRNALRRPRS
jgi:pRiA4b ORF-3-like protein